MALVQVQLMDQTEVVQNLELHQLFNLQAEVAVVQVMLLQRLVEMVALEEEQVILKPAAKELLEKEMTEEMETLQIHNMAQMAAVVVKLNLVQRLADHKQLLEETAQIIHQHTELNTVLLVFLEAAVEADLFILPFQAIVQEDQVAVANQIEILHQEVQENHRMVLIILAAEQVEEPIPEQQEELVVLELS